MRCTRSSAACRCFEARLIAAELFLMRDRILQFRVARIPRIRNQSRAKLGQIASRNRHLQHIFHIRFDSGIAAMSCGLHPPDHCQQSRPEDGSIEDVANVSHISFTVGGEINSQPMFGDEDRRFEEFDELVCLEFVGRCQSKPLDVFVSNFMVESFIDTFRWQVCPQMLLMPRLTTAFRLSAAPRFFRSLRFGDITGRRFR